MRTAGVASKDMEKILLEGVSSWGQSTFHGLYCDDFSSDGEVAAVEAAEAVAVNEAEAGMQLLLITKVRKATRYLLDRRRRRCCRGRRRGGLSTGERSLAKRLIKALQPILRVEAFPVHL